MAAPPPAAAAPSATPTGALLQAPAAPPLGTAPASPAPGVDHDASRRAFFRQAGRQAVTTVGQMAGMADLVSRTSGGAAASLLGLLDLGAPRRRGVVPPAVRAGGSAVADPRRTGTTRVVAAPPSAADAFRSPFRVSADTLILLDQRALPDRIEELVALRGIDVASYIRQGACSGGPLLAQLAAYGLALTAAEMATQAPSMRDRELRRIRGALEGARPTARLVGRAMDRMNAAARGLGQPSSPVDGASVAAAMRAEADVIAGEVQLGLAAIAESLAALLADASPAGRLSVLVQGDPGVLQGGLVGSGLTALRRLHEQGRALRVLVTETRPSEEGARLASWELRQAGIDHTIVPDAAVAWLLEHDDVDAILVAAEWVAANGDSAAVLGSRAIGQLAAATRASSAATSPRLIVLALSGAIDLETADGAAIPNGIPLVGGEPEPGVLPRYDVIAAEHVSALVTERGVLSPLDEARPATLLGRPADTDAATPEPALTDTAPADAGAPG
jgi:methylthioribose-1-phosphate isomerase